MKRNSKYPVPVSLQKCPKCKEYHGVVQSNELQWLNPVQRAKFEASAELIEVKCLCMGHKCRCCRKNRIHEPSSYSYNHEFNSVKRHPVQEAGVICDECMMAVPFEPNE